MGNVLPLETRAQIVAALVDGNSIRATSRMTGVDKNTVMRLGVRVGDGCVRLHNRIVRDVNSYVLSLDEAWGWCGKKGSRVTTEDPPGIGEQWTFAALDSTSKLIVSFVVGPRTEETTQALVNDLRARVAVEPHISTDGFAPYIPAIGAAFGGACDYGMVMKRYRVGAQRGPDHRYEPPREPFITKRPISGAPAEDLMSTSHVERFNLTARHMIGRMRRLCLAFSKKPENHRAAVALGIVAYNLVRTHATIRTVPAVAAGLVERPWTIAELVEMALAEPETEAPRAKPLAPRPGSGPARQTTTGNVLRLVPRGGAPGAPVAPSQPTAPVRARPMVQLNLFDTE